VSQQETPTHTHTCNTYTHIRAEAKHACTWDAAIAHVRWVYAMSVCVCCD